MTKSPVAIIVAWLANRRTKLHKQSESTELSTQATPGVIGDIILGIIERDVDVIREHPIDIALPLKDPADWYVSKSHNYASPFLHSILFLHCSGQLAADRFSADNAQQVCRLYAQRTFFSSIRLPPDVPQSLLCRRPISSAFNSIFEIAKPHYK